MLTAKQEKYVQNLVKGLSQREAYRKAYPSSLKWKDNIVDSKASNLFKNGKVLARYNELIEKASDDAIMSAIERKKWLTDVINNKQQEDVYLKAADGTETKIGSRNADLSIKMKAMDLLNKMDGVYITKLEGNINYSYEDKLKELADENEY